MIYEEAETLVAKLVQALEHKGRACANDIAPNASEEQITNLTQTYVNSSLKVFLAFTIAEMNDEHSAAIAKRIDRHCVN